MIDGAKDLDPPPNEGKLFLFMSGVLVGMDDAYETFEIGLDVVANDGRDATAEKFPT